MTVDLGILVLGFGAGVALGAAFFGGLWLTLGRAVRSPRPFAWLGWSAVARFAGALGAFYALSRLGAPALVAAAAGFLVARQGWLSAKRGGRVPGSAGVGGGA